MRAVVNGLLLSLILISCSANKDCLELGEGDYVIVDLELTDKEGINEIVFFGGGIFETASQEDRINYENVSFAFSGGGEGTLQVKIISENDTLLSAYYVENGYRPKLSCTKDTIIFKSYGGY